ncbi:YDG domain-containing protein [Eubacterium callanderi]|uniref:YDG domain-containing protein n=1 Tax=Eubacterium callanderi TaxID=53442 RepID=UPI001C10E783|nr:YDG domain-containing protein [Eubacterium callanderi]MBU5302595.1 Ig-like domain-containing protein [Eubacterium callanderi]
MKKEIPKKVVSGLMSGVMLFSSTGAPVMAETPADGDSLNTTGVVEKGASPTALQPAPQLHSRTDTSVTLKSDGASYYIGVAAGTLASEVIKETGWKQATGNTVEITGLTADTEYDFYSCAIGTGITEADLSPATTLYTLQAAPTTAELATITFTYPEETIQFDAATYEVNTVNDFSGAAVANGSSISDYVGSKLYVRKAAKGARPFGVAAEKTVDARPDNSTTVTWDEITRTTTGFSFTPKEGGVYQYSGGSVTTLRPITGGKVTGLQPGTAYTLVDYTAATDNAFASGRNSQTVRTKAVVAPATKDGPGASDRENTVKVDKTEADVNEVVTYTVGYSQNHTPSLTIGETELAFADAKSVDAETRTAVFEYTLTEKDTTVQAKVHFNNRMPQQAGKLDKKTLYANDIVNASAEALMGSLPKEVSVTYDNKTTGVVAANWQMQKDSRFNIKGGTYVFEAALGENIKATQAVDVLAVYAAFDAFEDAKLPVKAGGYNKEELGLVEKTTVTYTGNSMKSYQDKNVPVVWDQAVPAGFGSSQTHSQEFTGTVGVPEWATITSNQVSRTIKFGIPLTIKGLVLFNRAYDGRDVADSNAGQYTKFTLYDGATMVTGLTLSSSGAPVVHLDSANVGRRTVKSIDDLTISGTDADKYVLDFSNLTTEITRQTSVTAPGKPDVDAASVTDSAVTVSVANPMQNYTLEYAAVENGGTVGADTQWQNSGEFTGLKPGTEYAFYARYAETSNNEASPASVASTVKKTKASVAAPTKTGVGKNDPGCTVTADVEYAAVGEKVTYTVKTTENYTIGEKIKINGQEVALAKGSTADPETRLFPYTYEYTVLAADTTITAEASFNNRKVNSTTTAAYTAIDASDPANASQQALEQSLPQTVAVSYDNGASGSEPVLWTLDAAETWSVKGDTYTYKGKLANGSAAAVTDLSVEVNKVNATLPTIAAKTIPVRDKAYTMDELGLGKSLEVAFKSEANGAAEYKQDCAVSWNPGTPGNFGTPASTRQEETFAGTVTLPDWATVTDTKVTAVVKTAKPVTITGATVTAKDYNGNTDATLVISGATVSGAEAGDIVSLDSGITPTAVFENANAGKDKKVIVTGGALTGTDKDKYIIDWEASNITGEITKAPVSGTPAAPAVEPDKTTATSVTLTAMAVDTNYAPADVAGAKMQYSKDNVNWQDSPVFSGLEPGSSYRFYARVGATANTNASTASGPSVSVTTKTAVLQPVLEKDGDCFAGQSCKIELLDDKGNKISGVLEAEAGTTVTYKMSYCNTHTLHFNFKGSELALSETTPGMAKSKDEDRTWLYTYTVAAGDKTITASARADEHTVKSFEAEKIELFANDPANQSEDSLKALLPNAVHFTYDNGVKGTDVVTGWALKDGEWNIKGGTLTYEGSLKTMPKVKVTQKVEVKAVTATIQTQVSPLTVKQRDQGYTAAELAELGLPMNATISYDTFVNPGEKTCSIDWELPEGFGKEAGPASDITGAVALPEWATPQAGTNLLTVKITVDPRPAATLTIAPADVQKVYDGTPVITDVPVSLNAASLVTGHKDVALSSATATVRFQEPNVGSSLTYTVEDVRLTGADAAWYALKNTYNDGKITKAPVDKPAAPTIAEATTDSLTLNTVEPEGAAGIAGAKVIYKYSADGGKNFKDNDTAADKYSPVFKGLTPGKEYQFAVVVEGTNNTEASVQGNSLTARTKFNPGAPIISKASSCTAEVECKVELTDAAGKPIDENSALGAGDRVTYRITSCDNHTPTKLLVNNTEISLMGEGNTRTGQYTITEKDSNLVSKVTLSDRQVTGVTNPEMLVMYANDERNQSEKALLDSLPKDVEVTYDNGTKGSEKVNQWQLNTGSYSPAGGVYIYTATTVSGRIVLQMITVMEIEAVYEQPGDLTLQTNASGYSAKDLGLVSEIDVTFKSADGTVQETAPVAVTWSPEVPEGFGTEPAEQSFTGTLDIPAYAGGAKTVDRKVSIVAETPLKLTGLVVLDKTYDGTTKAVVNTDRIGLEGFVEGQGSVMLEGVDTMTAAFEDANAGAGKRVIVSGLSLTGPDAQYYSLDTSGHTGQILKADITGVVFESAKFPEDGNPHELKASYPENAGITDVQYTYTKDGVTSSTPPKEAGVYTVTAIFSVDGNHNALAPMEATMTIGNGAAVEAPVVEGVPDGVTGAAITADKELVTEVGETVEFTLTPSAPAAKAYVPYALEVNGQILAVELDTNTRTYRAIYTVTDADIAGGVQAKGLYTLLGDTSGEGTVNGVDALRSQRYTAGLDTPTPQQKAAADVNRDGKVNGVDALLIKRFAAKLIDKF